MGSGPADAKFHVLAVDDSLIDRKLIERLLKSSSFQVTAVDSGSKALQFLGLQDDEKRDPKPNPLSAFTAVDSGSKALQFLGLQDDEKRDPQPTPVSPNHHQETEVNLIITDYCMPGMTGYELLRKIKESKSLNYIPVVIMSSENIPTRINRCLEEGAEEFFLKPVQMHDVNKLRPHLMRGKQSQETTKHQ